MYQILPLLAWRECIPMLHNHWVVQAFLATLTGINSFIDVVKSSKIIAFLAEIDIGDPLAAAFVQIDAGMPGGCPSRTDFAGYNGADAGSVHQILAVGSAILPAFLIPTTTTMNTVGMETVNGHFGGVAALAIKFPYNRAVIVPFLGRSSGREPIKGFSGDVLLF